MTIEFCDRCGAKLEDDERAMMAERAWCGDCGKIIFPRVSSIKPRILAELVQIVYDMDDVKEKIKDPEDKKAFGKELDKLATLLNRHGASLHKGAIC